MWRAQIFTSSFVILRSISDVTWVLSISWGHFTSFRMLYDLLKHEESSQIARTVNENENEQGCAAMQKRKEETPLVMKHEKPRMPCFMVMYANISFLRRTFSMLLKNIMLRELPFLFFVHVSDQNQQS